MTIPTTVQTILDLFASDLGEVRFGDVDSRSLATLAAEVHAAAESVATAQNTLDAARAVLEQRQTALLQQAQRALAYARVFAEGDEALSARLEAIALPARKAGRTRGDAGDALVLSPEPQPARQRGPRSRASRAAQEASQDASSEGSAETGAEPVTVFEPVAAAE